MLALRPTLASWLTTRTRWLGSRPRRPQPQHHPRRRMRHLQQQRGSPQRQRHGEAPPTITTTQARTVKSLVGGGGVTPSHRDQDPPVCKKISPRSRKAA